MYPTFKHVFQFHKGTIRTLSLEKLLLIMVVFQFHKGTIRTYRRGLNLDIKNIFQFHKGTIRTLTMMLIYLCFLYFNSIKVRLEPGNPWLLMPKESMSLRVQRYKKFFRKMSMPKDIFSAALRQPAYLWRFQ